MGAIVMSPARGARAKRLHLWASATVAGTLILMVMGSLVHGTGSSLACPDWPLCYGSFFPAMTGGVEFEHTHRLIAAAVAALTVTVFLNARGRADKVTVKLAALACGLIAVQATLGGLTVIFRLPKAISIAHLGTSMAFLSTMVVLSMRLGPPGGRFPSFPKGGRWAATAAVVVFAQSVLGAVVRHSGAVLVCLDLPFCGRDDTWANDLTAIHMLHRGMGIVAAAVALLVSIAAFRTIERGAKMRVFALAIAPGVLSVGQIALGVTVVFARAPLSIVTLHHACGAALLASLVALATSASSSPYGSVDSGEGSVDQEPCRTPEPARR